MRRSITQHQPEDRWQDHSLCRGKSIDLFFLKRGEPVSPEVRELCRNCPVRTECLEHALHHERFGVWGGSTESEREVLRRERNIICVTPESYNTYNNEVHNKKVRKLQIQYSNRPTIYN